MPPRCVDRNRPTWSCGIGNRRRGGTCGTPIVCRHNRLYTPWGTAPSVLLSKPEGSEVDHVPTNTVGGFFDGLGQRRVGVNGVRNLIGGQFILLGQDEFRE